MSYRALLSNRGPRDTKATRGRVIICSFSLSLSLVRTFCSRKRVGRALMYIHKVRAPLSYLNNDNTVRLWALYTLFLRRSAYPPHHPHHHRPKKSIVIAHPARLEKKKKTQHRVQVSCCLPLNYTALMVLVYSHSNSPAPLSQASIFL